MKRLGGALLLTVTLLAGVPTAEATKRYATPTGSGTACTEPSPCGLAPAVEGAGANDEVIVGSGHYDIGAQVSLPAGATGAWVHGELSEPAPTIAAAHLNYALTFFVAGSRLSHVTVSNSAEQGHAIGCGADTTIEGVRAFVDQQKSYAIVSAIGTCRVRDTLARASGAQGAAVYAICEGGEPTLRNVTALAEAAQSVGVVAGNYGSPKMDPACTVDVRNALVSGGAADLRTFGVSLAYKAGISVSNSNFDTVVASSNPIAGIANQSAPPLFVDPIAGDYREAPGSPTIDAGGLDPLLGSLDLGGNPRVLGAAPDIGAFEYVPPPPPAPGQLKSMKIGSKTFRTANVGGAVISAARKKRRRAPLGTRVDYALSAAGNVAFTVERKLAGRRVGGKCRKATRANRRKKRCVRFRLLRGGFSHLGSAGANRFKFSGRIRGRALRPGRYRLLGRAGGARRVAGFRVVR